MQSSRKSTSREERARIVCLATSSSSASLHRKKRNLLRWSNTMAGKTRHPTTSTAVIPAHERARCAAAPASLYMMSRSQQCTAECPTRLPICVNHARAAHHAASRDAESGLWMHAMLPDVSGDVRVRLRECLSMTTTSCLKKSQVIARRRIRLPDPGLTADQGLWVPPAEPRVPWVRQS